MLSAAEQYQLELINRARLDPLAEAARQGIDLNQGLAPGTLDGNPRQPLAANAQLTAAAEAHSQWMLASNTFSHTGEGGSSLGDRITAAGYSWNRAGENIAWWGNTGSVNLHEAIVKHHDGLFESPGHRLNILNNFFREIGIAQERGAFTDKGTTYDTSMLTNKFAASGSTLFLTGVAYVDVDGDGFYSIGEGVSGTVFAIGGESASTAAAGGYALALGATSGSVTVTVSHGAVTLTAAVEVTGENVKLDLVDGTRLLASADLTLLDGVGEAALLGAGDLALTGNDAGNLLIGNAGANVITGGAGDDILKGGGGDDILHGGGGRNTALYAGNAADYVVAEEGAAIRVTDLRAGPHNEGSDLLHDIHVLRFADGDVVLVPEAPPEVPMVTLSGRIIDRAGQELAEAVVTFTPAGGGALRSAGSGADGRFALELAAETAGTLEIARGWSAGDPGITTASALEALRMAVGLQPTWGAARAADFIAADLDGDGRITSADALGILRSAVGLETPHSPHWIFVEAGAPLDGPDPAALSPVREMAIPGLEADHGVDLTGILVGQLLPFA